MLALDQLSACTFLCSLDLEKEDESIPFDVALPLILHSKMFLQQSSYSASVGHHSLYL